MTLPEEVLEHFRSLARTAPPVPRSFELEIAILLRPAAEAARQRIAAENVSALAGRARRVAAG